MVIFVKGSLEGDNYNKECYKKVILETKKIKDKKLRKILLNVWKELKLNNCTDFDIICEHFKV